VPNVLITPEWITAEAMRYLHDMPSTRPRLTINRTHEVVRQLAQQQPMAMNGKALLALGAAAVIANPEPLSRRSMLGLGWWRRYASKE